MRDPKISDLTVSQLENLIRKTVQEAVAEVIIEFSAAAELDAQLQYEAEMADFLRMTMKGIPLPELSGAPLLDD